MFIFSVFDRKYSFWGQIWSKKSKLFVEANIQHLDYIKYVKFGGDDHFSVLKLFFQVLPQKFIWHFDIT